jgi:AraC-like DNA-binding protein
MARRLSHSRGSALGAAALCRAGDSRRDGLARETGGEEISTSLPQRNRLKPNEYLQHVRIAKARGTMQSVNEIAWKIGYEDPGAFRKAFNRILELSPGEYRKRFWIANHSRVD